MRKRVESYTIALDLFKACSLAVKVHRKPEILNGIDRLDDGSLTITDEILAQVFYNINGNVAVKTGQLLSDNEFIAPEDVLDQPLTKVATNLGKIAAPRALNMMPAVYGCQQRRAA